MSEQAPLGGGASGPAEDAYYSMMDGDCTRALDLAEGNLADPDDRLTGPARTLYQGAASACLAAFERRTSLWPRAEAAFERAKRQTAGLSCEERAIYELTRRLVDAHRAEPSARLVKRSVGRGELVCPHFTRVTPDHGPAEGGYTVRIEGEHLPPVLGVTIGGGAPYHHVTAAVEDGHRLVVTIPPARYPELPAYLFPDGGHLIQNVEDGVSFTYDPPATTTRRSTGSTTTSQTTAPTSTTTPSPSSS